MTTGGDTISVDLEPLAQAMLQAYALKDTAHLPHIATCWAVITGFDVHDPRYTPSEVIMHFIGEARAVADGTATITLRATARRRTGR